MLDIRRGKVINFTRFIKIFVLSLGLSIILSGPTINTNAGVDKPPTNDVANYKYAEGASSTDGVIEVVDTGTTLGFK